MRLIAIISHVLTLLLFAVFGFFIIFFFKNIIEKADQKISFSSYSNADIEHYCVSKPIVEKVIPIAPPPPPLPEVEEIFTVEEEMPCFPGCEDRPKAELRACANQKMLQFIYKNIKYPAIARENGVEGTVVIRFYVDKDGSIKEPQILKDIGAGTGAEAMRVVKMMNSMGEKWTPGKQRGKTVKVYFNLPVKFRLE